MIWKLTNRADPLAALIADRHYTRQSIGARQFVQPGRCVVLLTPDADALWVTSWPNAEYVRHAWAGAWICSLFRNEAPDRYLSSELVTQAVAATRTIWGKPPRLGFVTFVDADRVRPKRDPGRCYRRAGWQPVGYTQSGLVALQLLPTHMPSPLAPLGFDLSSFRNNGLCPVCERSFVQPVRGRSRIYCGDACQQVAYRSRRGECK